MKRFILGAMLLFAVCAFAQEAEEPVLCNAISLSYSDQYGVTHAEGVYVLASVAIDATARTARVEFHAYHSVDAYSKNAKPTARLIWTASEIDSLSAISFNALIDWIVKASIALCPALSDGTPILVQK